MDLPMCPFFDFDFTSNMADSEGRRLSDLRVIDLRTELEKRNLDKSGVKVVLLDRLEKVLKEEGHDPETYLFDPVAMEKKSPVKRTARSGSTAEADLDDSVDDVNVDDMVIKDEIVDDDGDAELDKDVSDGDKQDPVAGDTQGSFKEELSKENPVKKRETSETSEEPSAKKVCKEESPVKSEHPAGGKRSSEINGMDTEDSINLDIGEDELLNEEGDGRLKVSKDGAGGAAPAQDGSGDQEPTGEAPRDPDSTTAQDSAAVDSAKSAVDTKSTSATAEGDKGTEEKDSKKSGSSSSSRNLWVSGLSGATRAKDLKMLCSRHGKVVGAKVVTNARTPGSRCYGYVTMVSAQDADACIKYLHRTELHGRMISVEKAKSELGAGGWGTGSWPAGNRAPRTYRRQDKPKGEGDTKEVEGKETKIKEEGEKKEGEVETKDTERPEGEGEEHKEPSKGDSQETKRKARERSGRKERAPHRRGLAGPRPPRDDVLSFSKIRKEREVQRERERLRRARSEERRRRAAEYALRDQERRQRMEKQRLALEREKLRVERERIEREKSELHRIERERQKLEREKLEFERLELKRAQMKLDEERRAKRGYAGYPSGSSPPWSKQGSAYDTSRGPPPKRPAFGGQGTAPPPPHFGDTAAAAPAPAYERSAPPTAVADKREGRDRERREYTRHAPAGGNSGGAMKYQSNGSSYESRQPLPPGTRPREQRYESGAGGRSERYSGAEGGRGGRSPKPTSRDHRYPESATTSKGEYDRQGSSWHGSGSSSAAKGGFPSAPPSWSKPGESWSGTGGSGERGGYSGGGGGYPNEVRYPLHQPAPPGSQVAGPFPDTRYTSQREYRKY